MSQASFEILSLTARYWFIFLIAIIVYRSIFWLVRDNRNFKKRLKSVPSAGKVGECVVLVGNDDVAQGQNFNIVREGTIGSALGCDIILKSKAIKKHQIYFRFEENKGLFIRTLSSEPVSLDGEAISKKTKNAIIVNGSSLKISNIELKFYFFGGLGVPTSELDKTIYNNKVIDAQAQYMQGLQNIYYQGYVQALSQLNNSYNQNLMETNNTEDFDDEEYDEEYVDEEYDDEDNEEEYADDTEVCVKEKSDDDLTFEPNTNENYYDDNVDVVTQNPQKLRRRNNY